MSSYDDFAWFYDRYWAAPFQEWQMQALDRLVLFDLKQPAIILDLCCGVGHLARDLSRRGFSVVGIDASSGMIELARQNAPRATLSVQMADSFLLSVPVDAALCTFDSINHMSSSETVLASFRCVRNSLKPGGAFVFDFNSPNAYGERWDANYTLVEPDHAFFLRGRFDAEAQLGHTSVTMFREMNGRWNRSDANFNQRPWTIAKLRELLMEAGFHSVNHWLAIDDLNMTGHYGIGRVYVRAR